MTLGEAVAWLEGRSVCLYTFRRIEACGGNPERCPQVSITFFVEGVGRFYVTGETLIEAVENAEAMRTDAVSRAVDLSPPVDGPSVPQGHPTADV